MIPAAQPPAMVWAAPGAAPFLGSFDDAVALIASTGIVDRAVLERLTEAAGARCQVRVIQDGERFDAMTFGRNRVVRNVIADTSAWPTDTPRSAYECVDRDGNALILPFACGNWSFERFPPVMPGYPFGAGDTGWSSWAGDTGEAAEAGYGSGFGSPGWSYGGVGFGLPGGSAYGGSEFSPNEISFQTPPESMWFNTPPGGNGPSGSPPSCCGSPSNVPTVPEPSTLSLLAVALLAMGLAAIARMRSRS